MLLKSLGIMLLQLSLLSGTLNAMSQLPVQPILTSTTPSELDSPEIVSNPNRSRRTLMHKVAYVVAAVGIAIIPNTPVLAQSHPNRHKQVFERTLEWGNGSRISDEEREERRQYLLREEARKKERARRRRGYTFNTYYTYFENGANLSDHARILNARLKTTEGGRNTLKIKIRNDSCYSSSHRFGSLSGRIKFKYVAPDGGYWYDSIKIDDSSTRGEVQILSQSGGFGLNPNGGKLTIYEDLYCGSTLSPF